ncbi:hypothetical protein [Cupriavidus numazuensis]|uniref:Uncharacterized protein n=1 Tax=Cupriavidus numazuensis TaxID=221992 RepID=A0ABN7PRE2_9BURK|nr:hypothetical protein [Cupriavidus numazuensis]CAG2132433.1 hypothetical protein LMG26411_00617 [Cupriavidus numazuensis]
MLNWLQPLKPARDLLLLIGIYIVGVITGAIFISGRHSGEQTAAKTVDKVITQTVTVTDTAQVKTLQTQLAAAKKEAADFQSQLTEAARAHPAPVACRLPDSLRDDLNR